VKPLSTRRMTMLVMPDGTYTVPCLIHKEYRAEAKPPFFSTSRPHRNCTCWLIWWERENIDVSDEEDELLEASWDEL